MNPPLEDLLTPEAYRRLSLPVAEQLLKEHGLGNLDPIPEDQAATLIEAQSARLDELAGLVYGPEGLVCAWCPEKAARTRRYEELTGLAASHGICPECRAKQHARRKATA